MNPFLAFALWFIATAAAAALHLGAPNRPKQPVKTIRNKHELRFL